MNNKILANIDIAGLVEWFRPSGEEYATGIAGKSSLVNTGDWLSRFMDDKVPGGWQFAMFHDELVGDFEKDTILGHNANALWSPVNITTMPGCFAASISANLFETGYDASVLGGQYTWDALCWGYDAIGNIYSWGIETSGEIIGFSVTQTSCILNWCFNWVKQVWE